VVIVIIAVAEENHWDDKRDGSLSMNGQGISSIQGKNKIK